MKIAIYLRLSVADNDLSEGNESNSIESQRFIIRDYIEKKPEFDNSTILEYVDDGYSGTNFERPGFKRMLDDSKNGIIDTIIVKDLSRLGRDYIETGDYLDQIFPMLGIRVIAINSGYDSNSHKGDVSGLDVAITNYINSLYSWDLSDKVKSSIRAGWKAGKSYVCTMPYGYRYDKATKQKWIIDQEAAEVIRSIFDLAASNHSLNSIVNIINAKKIIPPGKHRMDTDGIRYNKVVTDKEYIWDKTKIRRILTNYSYTGATVCHKQETVPYMFSKCRSVPKKDWVILENDHEGIVDKKTYEKAQRILATGTRFKNKKPARYSLKSKLRCSNCNLMFSYYNSGDKEICYCAHKRNSGKYSKCNGREHFYDVIEKRVHEVLKKYISDMKIMDTILDSVIPKITPVYMKSIDELEERTAFLRNERIEQYKMYSEGIINIDQYSSKKAELNTEIEKIEKRVVEIQSFVDDDNKLVNDIRSIEKEAEKNELDKLLNTRIVNMLVNQVYVDEYDNISIDFKFTDLIRDAMERSNYLMEYFYGKDGKLADKPEAKNYISFELNNKIG